MKQKFLILLTALLIAASLFQITACKTNLPAATPALTATTNSPLSSVSTISIPATSTLTIEEAKKQLEQEGSTFIDTGEKASQLAGFKIANPSFIPQGFAPQVFNNNGIYNVYKLGFGLPLPRASYSVDMVFRPNGLVSNGPPIIFTQTPDKLGITGNPKEIDIDGHACNETLIPADDKNPRFCSDFLERRYFVLLTPIPFNQSHR